MDAWHWKDALVKEMMEYTLTFLLTFRRSGWWAEPVLKPTKEYAKEVQELSSYLSNAKAYLGESSKERNIVLESTKVYLMVLKLYLSMPMKRKTNYRCSTVCKQSGIKKNGYCWRL
jgi:hypothetical protein